MQRILSALWVCFLAVLLVIFAQALELGIPKLATNPQPMREKEATTSECVSYHITPSALTKETCELQHTSCFAFKEDLYTATHNSNTETQRGPSLSQPDDWPLACAHYSPTSCTARFKSHNIVQLCDRLEGNKSQPDPTLKICLIVMEPALQTFLFWFVNFCTTGTKQKFCSPKKSRL